MRLMMRIFVHISIMVLTAGFVCCKDVKPEYELDISCLVDESRAEKNFLSKYYERGVIDSNYSQYKNNNHLHIDRLIIKIEPSFSVNRLLADGSYVKAFEKFGKIEQIGQNMANIFVVRLYNKTRTDRDSLINYYESLPGVSYAEPDYKVKACAYDGTNDPMYSVYQWDMQDMNLEDAWNFTYGSQDVRVAILDSGVAYTDDPGTPHDLGCIPDLEGTSFIHGYDYINNDEIAYDDHNHGTHTAGIIASGIDDGVGYVGIAPNVTLIPYKVVDKDNEGNVSHLVEAIYDAVDKDADIINIGLYTEFETQSLEEACVYAYSNDVLIFSATGNGSTYAVYPSVYDGVIGVGAVTSDKSVADYSNFGYAVDIVAYGGDYADGNDDGKPDYIFQKTIGGYNEGSGIDYAFYDAGFSGTSQATAHATGLGALLKSYKPGSSNRFIEAILKNTADNLVSGSVYDMYYGFGLIHAVDSLNTLKLLSESGITSASNVVKRYRNTFSASVSEEFSVEVVGGFIKIACNIYHSENYKILLELLKDGVVLSSSTDGSIRYDVGSAGGEYSVKISIDEF